MSLKEQDMLLKYQNCEELLFNNIKDAWHYYKHNANKNSCTRHQITTGYNKKYDSPNDRLNLVSEILSLSVDINGQFVSVQNLINKDQLHDILTTFTWSDSEIASITITSVAIVNYDLVDVVMDCDTKIILQYIPMRITGYIEMFPVKGEITVNNITIANNSVFKACYKQQRADELSISNVYEIIEAFAPIEVYKPE